MKNQFGLVVKVLDLELGPILKYFKQGTAPVMTYFNKTWTAANFKDMHQRSLYVHGNASCHKAQKMSFNVILVSEM